jgi:hypothetical protein
MLSGDSRWFLRASPVLPLPVTTRAGVSIGRKVGQAQPFFLSTTPALPSTSEEVSSDRSRCDEKLVRSRQRAVRGRAVRD